MLEYTSLLLGPWQLPTKDGLNFLRRTIVDDVGESVGHAQLSIAKGHRWLHWLSQRTLDVFEKPDNSLLFALQRGWGWLATWNVVDADDRLVGTLRRRALLDGYGLPLGINEPPRRQAAGRFLATHGRELGKYQVERDSIRLTFSPELDGNPFARMMLLAAVLAGDG